MENSFSLDLKSATLWRLLRVPNFVIRVDTGTQGLYLDTFTSLTRTYQFIDIRISLGSDNDGCEGNGILGPYIA